MTHRKPRFQTIRITLLLACVILCAGSINVFAHQFGQVGSSQGGCGGFGCHGGQSAATTVALNGPTTVTPGSVNNYTFTVAHANNNYSGFNVSIAQGNLAPAGGNVQLMNNELTHTAPTADGAGGYAEFAFTWTAPNQPGQYTFYGAGNAVNNSGTADGGDVHNTTGGIQVTVKGVNITAPAGGTYCRGTSVTLNWTQFGFTTFKIEVSSNDFASSEVLTNSISATANTYTWAIPAGQTPSSTYAFRIVNTADGQELKRSSNFAVKGAPTITTQPLSQTVCEGRNLQMFIATDHAGATYQWKKDGNVIPGATTAAYQVAVATPNDAGSYEAVAFGCGGSATSTAAVVTITLRPKITVQPTAKTVCQNDSISLFADGEGTSLNYQWYKNGAAIPGKTSPTLKFTSAQLTDEGSYALHVSSTCLPDAVSNEVTLTVNELPKITTQPTDKNLKVGDSLVLSVDGFGEGVTYQWRRDGNEIPGATQKTYRKGNVVRADSGQYDVQLKSPCDTVTSRKALVRIIPADGPGIPELAAATLELGAIPMCARIDTTLVGLLKNSGGSPLVVTSISADPPTLLNAQDFATPQTIAVGAASDLHLIVTPSSLGTITGTVTFFTANGNATFNVNGSSEPGISVSSDTLKFLEGDANFERCVTLTLDARCSTATVTAATLSGVGAGSYSSSTTLPVELTGGNSVDLCFKTTATSGGDASVVIETSAGPRTVNFIRAVFSSVEYTDLPGFSIQPNPATDGVSLKGLPQGATVRIISLQGVEVATLAAADQSGGTDVVWNARDNSGAAVSSGTYIVVISANQKMSAHPLVITR